MPQTNPFTIYNASAGSGKTYTLVKEYLKLLFQSDNLFHFKRILAITFTNKAVAEMKDRIIDTLKTFSNETIINESNSMFESICEDLNFEPKKLQKKSEILLHTIIHNYAAFDISTIDGFTHKLIRTFAHDLKLTLNFEVELDQDTLLNEAVNSLISKTGTNPDLTKVLIEFAIEKADGDRSWDVSFDFNKIAKLLVNENDKFFIDKLENKSLDDFKTLKSQLKKDISNVEKDIVENAKSILILIEEAGLEHKDFSGGFLPKHLEKLADKNFNLNFETKWQEDLESKTLYPKRVTGSVASTIEQIQPQIASAFSETKQAVYHLKFLKAFYKNITPLSVLNAINNELTQLKKSQNKMLISEFNSIISKEIKAQPTPFIYERIGEKFKHYFIDEFQDTSVMQWENLIPLIENSLSTESGSTILVGDAKQAIYRWRGGKAEQFIDLFNDKNPFHAEKQVENLPSNFRSFKEIVEFNNGFFSFLAHQVFNNEDYKTLYENANQTISKDKYGYVELSFLDINKGDDRDDIFPAKVLEKIKNCQEKGFRLEDICVLVRKKKEGIAIANYLSLNSIPIISSETLLLNNSPEVVFINNVLALLNKPDNNEIKIKVLNFMAELLNIEDKHHFFVNHISLNTSELFKSFENYNITVSSEYLLQLPLYDLVETIVRTFSLVDNSNAYIQFYLDVVLDFSQKKGSDISGFLDYFERKKESLSIISPKGQNAVQIMTIHKSKGLEFPVVIFPYADLDIYKEIEAKAWYKIDPQKYSGFSHTLLNFNKDFEFFGEEGQHIYNTHQSELELDNINLLYVALTRPIEQLYIISTKDISTKGEVDSKKYSSLLIRYLQHIGAWNDSDLTYCFGSSEKKLNSQINKELISVEHQFISTAKEDHNIRVVTKSGYLWDTSQQEAIEKGNLIHNIMSQIITTNDIDAILIDFIKSSKINQRQAEVLKKTVLLVINHPQLNDYFNSNYTIYNERDIISKDGLILRPDRVVINSEKKAVILDYKTGLEDEKHAQQLQSYQDALEEMNIEVKKKILIYLNEDVKVKNV